MDIQKFIDKTPFLYHLTSAGNAKIILAGKKLYSANALIKMTNDPMNEKIGTNKRFTHQELLVNGNKVSLRDQRPISEVALAKCLTDNWEISDFLYHLNNRVFMWPNLARLERHFNRYKSENPIIFRLSTADIIKANTHVKFCRLNSGATRANSYLGGIAPKRGSRTFLSADDYDLPVNSVAEVTFEDFCDITGSFGMDVQPRGNFNSKCL